MSTGVPVKTVKRSFQIIEVLRDNGATGTSRLSELVGLPTSTVHDHLQTLETHGCVVRSNGGYRLGTWFLYQGDKIRQQMQIYKSSVDELQNLADETGEHASITVEEDGLGVVLHDVRGRDAIKFNSYPGLRTKLHLSAGGKAILATLSDETVERIVEERGLAPLTENTIVDPDELFREIEETRPRGFALDLEESLEGMRGVGVPVVDRDESVLGAISLYGPRSRIDDSKLTDEFPTLLQEAANVIEVDYNFRGGE